LRTCEPLTLPVLPPAGISPPTIAVHVNVATGVRYNDAVGRRDREARNEPYARYGH
jgi:hypothetical protein